jgi:phage-related protein
MKRVTFVGSSLEDIRDFPVAVRKQVGFQLDRLQNGLEPNHWKPMKSIGPGVREIRIREASGAFRVIYLAAVADDVFVLHAFVKKSQSTSQGDIDVAIARFKEIARGGRNE